MVNVNGCSSRARSRRSAARRCCACGASSTAGDRGSPAASLVRVRRIAGCDVGVLIRDQNADLVLAFDQRGDRDRLAAKLR
jgi:hypothetical protein